eukprot:scaffold5875_cov53-Attheya_sp.AAC.15
MCVARRPLLLVGGWARPPPTQTLQPGWEKSPGYRALVYGHSYLHELSHRVGAHRPPGAPTKLLKSAH